MHVTTGPFSGSTATTAFDGWYQLFGVAGDVTIKVTRPGYRDRSEQVVVGGDQALLFNLDGVAPIPQIEGTYRLTIAASARCRDALPADVRTRSYAAEIRRSGAAGFYGLLSEADFQSDPQNVLSGKFNIFGGWILAGGDVTLDFEIYGDPAVVERVGTTLLSIAVVGAAHFDGVGYSGTLAGDFIVGTSVACQAQDHLIELVRQ